MSENFIFKSLGYQEFGVLYERKWNLLGVSKPYNWILPFISAMKALYKRLYKINWRCVH